ncbi:MAG: MFS transporter [Chloroflexi bacterium]|nr:MFS transporter [Chloroflexota bacterium]MDA1271301.1 MFS transporter [Chloroflexota bacterium]
MRTDRTLPTSFVLGLIGLGAFITALDQTVVVTALPSVMLDLKVPIIELDRVSWVITAYLLGYTVAMPLIGRLGDVYGYPRVYQASLVVFCIGTSLVAVSSSLEWMIGARVVQAVGGGATVPIGMALATTLVPKEQRGLALGIVGASAEAGSMLGPAYGGGIVELLGWRWIFWLNVPQSAVIFLGLMWLPNRRDQRAKVDYMGGVILVGALLVLSLALSRTALFTFDSPYPFLLAAGGLGLVALLVLVEARTYQPLLTPLLFRSWAFLSSNLTQVLVGVALIIAMITVPLMANTVMGKSPLTGAMWLLRLTGIIPVGAVVGGMLVTRLGSGPLTAVGLAMVSVGMFLASGWDLGVGDPELTVHLLIAGFGFGLVIAPITVHAIGAADEGYRGTAASLVVVSRMMGMTLGLAALSAWGVGHFQTLTLGLEFPLPQLGDGAGVYESRAAEYTANLNAAGLELFRRFFLVASVVSLAAIVPALAMKRGTRS